MLSGAKIAIPEHYQTLMTALYEKDVIDLLYLFGQGIDLTWSVPDGGHTSSFTLAIFRDNDSDTYKFQASKDCISLGLGSALRICSCNRSPTSSRQSSSRLLCWNWQLNSATHTWSSYF